jgi:hypothetical protein
VVQVIPNGPVMVQGPVRIELPDGSVVASDRFMVAICACGAARHIRCATPAIGGAAERPMRQLSGRRSDVRPIVQHSLPDTGWCTVSSPRLAANPCAGYPPSVSEPVAQRPVVGPPGPACAHTNGFVPQSLSSDGRSGGQRGGADRRLCPVWRPLRFLADWCEAGGCQCVVGLVRNTRRNLPI